MSARVIITGAASGIGAATAEELRRRGARVAGLDLRADAVAGFRPAEHAFQRRTTVSAISRETTITT